MRTALRCCSVSNWMPALKRPAAKPEKSFQTEKLEQLHSHVIGRLSGVIHLMKHSFDWSVLGGRGGAGATPARGRQRRRNRSHQEHRGDHRARRQSQGQTLSCSACRRNTKTYCDKVTTTAKTSASLGWKSSVTWSWTRSGSGKMAPFAIQKGNMYDCEMWSRMVISTH